MRPMKANFGLGIISIGDRMKSEHKLTKAPYNADAAKDEILLIQAVVEESAKEQIESHSFPAHYNGRPPFFLVEATSTCAPNFEKG